MKFRLTSYYQTHEEALKEEERMRKVVNTLATKVDIEKLNSKIYDIKLESMPKLEYREDIKRFREESNSLYSSKTGTEQNIERITSHIPTMTKEIGVLSQQVAEIQKNEHSTKTYMNKMFNSLNNKIDLDYKDEVDKKFKQYCAYSDLKILESRVIPVIDKFKHNIQDFKDEIVQHTKIIERFDELICDKVSKFEFEVTKNRLNDFLLSDEFEHHIRKNELLLKAIHETIEEVKEETIEYKSMISAMIHSSLENVTATLEENIHKIIGDT